MHYLKCGTPTGGGVRQRRTEYRNRDSVPCERHEVMHPKNVIIKVSKYCVCKLATTHGTHDFQFISIHQPCTIKLTAWHNFAITL